MVTDESTVAIPQLIYEAVSRGKREWEQTFDSIADLIFITDTNHTISRANRAMARHCGLRPEDLPGRKCYDLFHDLASPPPYCPLNGLKEGGAPRAKEVEVAKFCGFFDISVSPLYNDDGTLAACVHVARDVTERKKAEEYRLELEQQLLQSQKLESLGVLTGGIAHDFNNILMIILGHCLLAKENQASAPVVGHLDQIESAGNRAADLCRQMLAYAGKAPLIQTRIDLPALVRDMVQMLQPAFNKKVTIECDLGRDLPKLTCDEGKIQQIVMNLVVNAAESLGEQGGKVKVTLSHKTVLQAEQEIDCFGNAIPPGTYQCLQVADTGCGMDQETQKRIFEPFFTTKFTGRGLGLSAISGIIRSHNGSLQLCSAPGAGTTFSVYFPLPPCCPAGDEVAAPLPLPLTAAARLEGTILLVDDEEQLRAVGCELLTSMGFKVIGANNGSEALAIWQERKSEIDLVLMDLTMPELDGVETYRTLREDTPTLPVLFCSGYGDQDIRPCTGEDPRAGFIAKPYQLAQLRSALAALWKTA
ncbi:hybrid sensor histidine kinase/response regulator [Citrifermentans bremense]|uniref:hybrid sensor histidine kinase/response regulator n=1 Tax=Citrifermentans bremense TaxID=60035 RepID=UPI0003FE6433|nr:PAS domain-containing sensor histidine kinase [Citrifermentans bremense]